MNELSWVSWVSSCRRLVNTTPMQHVHLNLRCVLIMMWPRVIFFPLSVSRIWLIYVDRSCWTQGWAVQILMVIWISSSVFVVAKPLNVTFKCLWEKATAVCFFFCFKGKKIIQSSSFIKYLKPFYMLIPLHVQVMNNRSLKLLNFYEVLCSLTWFENFYETLCEIFFNRNAWLNMSKYNWKCPIWILEVACLLRWIKMGC